MATQRPAETTIGDGAGENKNFHSSLGGGLSVRRDYWIHDIRLEAFAVQKLPAAAKAGFANAAFDIGASPLYTDEGVRTLRNGRDCCVAWLLFWGIGIAIAAVAGGYR